MLKQTFLHINGIGPKVEQLIWDEGVYNWDDILIKNISFFSKDRLKEVREKIEISIDNFNQNNMGFFKKSIPSKHLWRLYPHYKNSILYIDIESTGIVTNTNHVTSIAAYDGGNVFTFVYGQDLEDFPDFIKRYDVLVTYNGKAFDVPFLEKTLGINIPHPNIDLMYPLRNLGYKGGLKKCEKSLGINRKNVDGIDGLFAIFLWKEFQETYNKNALETLIAYNVEDAINLEKIMVMVYNKMVDQLPNISIKKLKVPGKPNNPYQVDSKVVDMINEKYYNFY